MKESTYTGQSLCEVDERPAAGGQGDAERDAEGGGARLWRGVNFAHKATMAPQQTEAERKE